MIDSTDKSLFTKTSDDRILEWDKYKIIKSLEKETGLDQDVAGKIADNVEYLIKDNKLKVVTTTLIRELINAELINLGFVKERNKYCRLGMPISDVKDLILQHNKENANVPHNPEATNLTIAGNIKKEFALLEIFPNSVSEAHLRGDIHLHDLDYIDRCYSYIGSECIICKYRNEIKNISFYRLFEKTIFTYEENGTEIGILSNEWFVYDINGWTKLKKIIRHKKNNKTILWISTQNSKSLLVTSDHPMIIKGTTKNIPAKELKFGKDGDELITINKIDKNKLQIDYINYIDLIQDEAKLGNFSEYYFDNILINNEYEISNISYGKLNQIKKEYNNIKSTSKTLIYSKTNGHSKKYSSLIKLTPEFCYFIGVFIAEGCYEKNAISLSIGKEEKEKIIKFLNNNNIGYNLNKREECYIIRIFSKFYHDLFKNYFGIKSKSRFICLPENILLWEPKLSFSVLSGIIDGDGNTTNIGININTSSKTLINQINHLLLTQGMKSCSCLRNGAGSIRYYKGKEIKQNYNIFQCSFSIPEEKKDLFKLSRKVKNTGNPKSYKDNIRKIKPIETQEKYIYDITTESGTFICNGILVHNCSGNNIEYIKKFGLNFPNALSIAKPAKHPEVLIAHILKFSAALQGVFAGAIGWDAVNIFIAPYLVGMDYNEIKQLAQILIFEFSQQAVSRGGQTIFSDINLYWEIPKHFENIEAIGPMGKYTGKKYKEYSKESQQFIKAIFEVFLEGDGSNRPFMFPKPNFHITEKFFKTPGHEQFLELVSELASKFGNTYFIFDRGSTVKISECCRMSRVLSDKDLAESNQPWKMRFSALQNVTLNLPRIIYESGGNYNKILNVLKYRMNLAAKAHIVKRKFIKELMKKGYDGPLALLTMNLDGESYLRLHKATHLIGMVGLNEAIKAYSGQELHENNTALMDGLRLISWMHDISKELSKKYGINFVLEQTPAESTSYRFAKLDINSFPDALHFIKGDSKNNQVYYTNSTQLSVASNIDPIKRVSLEGKFHPLIEAGSMTHIWIGEYKPNKKAIASFVKAVFKNTSNDQICFSPEFTSCKKCFKTSRGLNEKCIYCGSNEVEGITRITGYFSKISGWNPGKLSELKDRKKWRI